MTMIDGKLLEALGAPEESERRSAAQEISESGDSGAPDVLVSQLHREGSRVVKEAILRGLSRIWTSNPVESSTARHLQENIAPLTHIAFHFRLEASRLSPKDSASVVKAYEEMKQVVGFMTKAGDSQQSALLTILGKLSAATRLVEQTCASYALQAAESEQNVVRHLDLISNRPPQPARAQNKASALGIVLATSIGEAVKALQGHDAIRQASSISWAHWPRFAKTNPKNQQDDPGHALLLQRQQAKCLLEMVVNTLRRRPWLAAGEDDRQLR